MKIAGPLLNQHRKHAKKKWMLVYYAPVTLPGGLSKLKRFRPHYKTKEDAEADKPRIAAQYATAGTTTAGVLSRDQVADYEAAKAEVPEAAMLDLARFWRLHHPKQATLTIGDLVPKFLEWVNARIGETRHYDDLKSRLTMFAGRFGGRLPATFTREEFLSYLLGLGKGSRTVLNQKRAVVNFFNWLVDEAKAQPRNHLAGIKKRSLPKDVPKEIAFLSLVQVNRYLRAAERYDPDLIAYEIIQLKAGVRADDEMDDFRGEFVKAETREVVIPAEIAKTGRREVIDNLEANFWSWWQHYGREGLLRVANYEQRWKRVRVLASIDDRAKADELARLPIKTLLKLPDAAAALEAWPWNARRRTFCTYHVAKHQSANRTALILRHRGEASTLHNSYRGTGVTQAQGVAYFEIMPNPVFRIIYPARPARGVIKLQAVRKQSEAAPAAIVA